MRGEIIRALASSSSGLTLSEVALSVREPVLMKVSKVLRDLQHERVVRGAIARGRLHHEEAVIFGEALIKAYDLESRIVRYPRIMVTSDVAKVANGTDKLAGACRNRFRQAEDGPLYLHVLQNMQKEMNDSALGPDNDEGDKFGGYATIKSLIEERYQDAIDNPAHFEKVQWFARYWNSCLPANASSFRILGPGL
jgi:hypothetical protein